MFDTSVASGFKYHEKMICFAGCHMACLLKLAVGPWLQVRRISHSKLSCLIHCSYSSVTTRTHVIIPQFTAIP